MRTRDLQPLLLKLERACKGLLEDLDAAGETDLRDKLVGELAALRETCEALAMEGGA